jgi:hypothetical protein
MVIVSEVLTAWYTLYVCMYILMYIHQVHTYYVVTLRGGAAWLSPLPSFSTAEEHNTKLSFAP